jgi:endonuclease/exonuclease/phosphatase family metal-dependent hydrolase
MPNYYIAFWNVENLLDVEDAPLSRRPDKVRRALKVGTPSSEVKGWDQAALDRKILRLSLVIKQMNAGRGPDILGVCEVENRHVLDLLAASLAPTGRQYAVVHADTADQRGIDVAFLYDRAVFEVEAGGVFSHYIVKRTATRDLLQVNFMDDRGRRLVCIGNHWPSRLGGRFESEAFRIIAAETLAYFHERIVGIHGKDVALLVMGDFNDEPWDRSLSDHARSYRTHAKVTRASSPALLNLMWPTGGALKGTHFHDNQPGVLDQFLVSKGLLTGRSGFTVEPDATVVLDLPVMVNVGVYPQPRRHGRPASPANYDPDGFSDHYPVVTEVRRS